MSSTPDPIFIAEYEYTSKNEGELNFTVGDRVIVLKTDGDWLYGRHTITHTEGWLPLSYGHIRKISPYVSLDTVLKLSKRQELLESSKVTEKEFVDSLHELFDKVINPLQLRDTVFKRNFLSNGRVAVSFNLLADIQKACSNFLVSLETSRKDAEIADAYLQFAPSLQLFAQYCSENPALLNTIQQNSKGLTPIIGKFNLIESIISPLQHYSTYQHNFQEFVWLTIDTDNDAMNNIERALDIITAQSEYVNAKLKQESEHMRLLTLQNQFIGNPSIFNADRKLLRESEIELVKIKINGDHQITSYYAHLFNDALIYSSQSVISGNFKLCGMIELQGATFQIHELGGTKTGFSLSKRETPEQFEHFKLPNEEQTIDWFSVIIQQIEELEKVKAKQSGSTPIIDQFINTVDVGTLGPRCSLIFKLLNSEKQFAELLSALNTTFIRPLIDASKGAVLRAVPSHECNTVTDSITISKYERELITEALQEADIPIFLHAAEGISNSLKDFISFLEILCQSNWTEGLLIGNFFLSVNALTLYDRLKSYSSSQPAMLRVLKNPIFTNFQKDVEGFLTHLPGTLLEKLEFPQKRIMVYISILSDIQKVTLSSHSDYSSLTIALNKLNTVEQEIIESVKSKKNFEKLLEIQSSLITILTEPIIEKLVTMERKFLKEGDLMKVCRRKNKLFRFWLFNDYLIYASSLGGDKYSFNRALELNKCSIQTYNLNELKNAFEIIGEEKSFILIAPSNIIYEEWFNAIKKITQSFQGIRKESILQESAPLSKPNQSDQNCDECTQCHKPFTFWNRRHHCHKCDAFVCNNHLNNREIIPHISKTQKQKICDNCFSGKTIMITPTKAMDNVGVSKISDISTVGKKIVTTTSLQQQKSYESEKRDPVELKANRLPMKAKLVGSNPFTDDLSQASVPGIESIVVTRKEESTSVPPIVVVPPVSSLKSKVENDANSMPITRPPPPPPPPPPARAQPLIKLELLPLSPGKQFHVFLTHNWSDDLHGRNNHSRVARVNQGLKQRGFITWFDEERMTGHIRQTMANALYQSMSVAVFITRIYENKINSNNHADNCLYEFNATSNHSILVNTRLAIGMETMMLNPRNWIDGRLKAELGGELIIDMTNDEDDIFEKQCDVLADRLRAIVVFSE